jgi:SAM-dependent methyltransferase
MTPAETAVRARSFGSVARTYDRYRPGPPGAAVDWVLGGPCGLAVDLGAGTGKLARRLAERADRVVAVEPDVRMLSVLHARSPGIAGVCAVAERLPVAGGSADAVLASSAWHWMDAEATLDEASRVLRPGGVLGIVGGGPDRSVGWLAELLGGRVRPAGDRTPPGERHPFELPAGAPFRDLDSTVVRWTLPRTEEELVGLTETYSAMITLAPGERAAEQDRIRGRIAAFAAERGAGPYDIPMRCRCWRAVRRSPV